MSSSTNYSFFNLYNTNKFTKQVQDDSKKMNDVEEYIGTIQDQIDKTYNQLSTIITGHVSQKKLNIKTKHNAFDNKKTSLRKDNHRLSTKSDYLQMLKENILKNSTTHRKFALKNNFVKNKFIDSLLEKDENIRQKNISRYVMQETMHKERSASLLDKKESTGSILKSRKTLEIFNAPMINKATIISPLNSTNFNTEVPFSTINKRLSISKPKIKFNFTGKNENLTQIIKNPKRLASNISGFSPLNLELPSNDIEGKSLLKKKVIDNVIYYRQKDGVISPNSSLHENISYLERYSEGSSADDEEAFNRINHIKPTYNNMYSNAFIQKMTKKQSLNDKEKETKIQSHNNLNNLSNLTGSILNKNPYLTSNFSEMQIIKDKLALTSNRILSQCNETHSNCKDLLYDIQDMEKKLLSNEEFINFKDDLKHSLGKRYIGCKEANSLRSFEKPGAYNLKNAGAFIYFKGNNKKKRYISTDDGNTLSKSEAISSINSINAYKFKQYLEGKFNVGIDKNDVFGLKNERKGINTKDKVIIDMNKLKIPNNPLFEKVNKILDDGIKKKTYINNKFFSK